MKKALTIIIFFNIIIFSQENNKKYFITAEGGFGYSRFFSALMKDNFNKNGISATLRFMWNPEHLLAVGLETGYYHLYSYKKGGVETEFGKTDIKSSLISVPLLIMFTMRTPLYVKFHAGSGLLLLYNQGEAFKSKFNSTDISITDYVGLSYNYDMYKNLEIGAEFKYAYIFKLEDAYVSFQLTATYKLFEY